MSPTLRLTFQDHHQHNDLIATPPTPPPTMLKQLLKTPHLLDLNTTSIYSSAVSCTTACLDDLSLLSIPVRHAPFHSRAYENWQCAPAHKLALMHYHGSPNPSSSITEWMMRMCLQQSSSVSRCPCSSFGELTNCKVTLGGVFTCPTLEILLIQHPLDGSRCVCENELAARATNGVAGSRGRRSKVRKHVAGRQVQNHGTASVERQGGRF